MSNIQSIIEELQSRDYSDRDLLAVLSDKEALAKVGLGDEDPRHVKGAFNIVFDRVYPGLSVSSKPLDEVELGDIRARRCEADIRYSIKGDL